MAGSTSALRCATFEVLVFSSTPIALLPRLPPRRAAQAPRGRASQRRSLRFIDIGKDDIASLDLNRASSAADGRGHAQRPEVDRIVGYWGPSGFFSCCRTF
jgi:hypothetical protein